MKTRWQRVIWIAPLALLAIALFLFIGGEIVMYLWNWLVPPLFGWREITFWQALGLLLLCRILFGGSGWRGSPRSSIRHRIADRIADRMAERCEQMSPGERERFRQRMRERWGFDPASDKGKEQ